ARFVVSQNVHMTFMDRDEFGSGGGVALRLFVAIPVARDIANRLVDHASSLADRIPGARAMDPRELHMTVAFLGNVVEEHVPIVASALARAAGEIPGPTECSITGIAKLPSNNIHAVEISVDLSVIVNAARDTFLDEIAPYCPNVDRRPWWPHVSLIRGAD